ncbi:V-type proton ATPase subunit E-like [Diadema setosum]|uniref:V-type proton ATPase subunit E-like n=1 Tax=Diadema setosum TaxID=31175 RepID=UPI003B3A88AF
MALSDEDVQKQIQHMMAFIDQEAKEKAEEIDAKAEEEFQIEKGRLVQQQRIKITDFYGRKEKNLDLQKKILQSNMLNQARLKVLKCREDHVQAVLDEAQERLTELTKNRTQYKEVIKGLLSQGLYQLLEPNVVVRCKECDVSLVKETVPDAVKSYREATKKECNVVVDQENFLSPEVSGGVDMYTPNGKIKVENTLEKRLDLLSKQMLPEIRTKLFGPNNNRKFMD